MGSTVLFGVWPYATALISAQTFTNLRAVLRGPSPTRSLLSSLPSLGISPGAICSNYCSPCKGSIGGNGGSFPGDRCARPAGNLNIISCRFLGGINCHPVRESGGDSHLPSGSECCCPGGLALPMALPWRPVLLAPAAGLHWSAVAVFSQDTHSAVLGTDLAAVVVLLSERDVSCTWTILGAFTLLKAPILVALVLNRCGLFPRRRKERL